MISQSPVWASAEFYCSTSSSGSTIVQVVLVPHTKSFFYFYDLGDFSVGCFSGRKSRPTPAYVPVGPCLHRPGVWLFLTDVRHVTVQLEFHYGQQMIESLCCVVLRLRLVGVWPDLDLSGQLENKIWEPFFDKHHCTTTTTSNTLRNVPNKCFVGIHNHIWVMIIY